MYSIQSLTQLPGPATQSARLLDRVRERIRYLHYSPRTDEAHLYWIRAFILWHPRELGGVQVEQFLNAPTNGRKVAASTRKQALCALLLLYRELLGRSDVSTTMAHTHVLRIAAGSVASPLDRLAAHA
jgi:hypothetical protein